MKSFHQLQEETTGLHMDFLLTDLSACSTFVDIAQTTRNSITRARNLHNANVAHAAVLRFLPRVAMSRQQNQELLKRLSELQERINSFEFLGRSTQSDSGFQPDAEVRQA